MRTYFSEGAVPGEMGRLSAQFTRPSIRVHPLAIVLRTRTREMAATRTYEARSERQRVVWVFRLATPRKVVFLRAASIADADSGGTSPGRPTDCVRVGLSVPPRNTTGKALQVGRLTADELRAIDRDDALTSLRSDQTSPSRRGYPARSVRC